MNYKKYFEKAKEAGIEELELSITKSYSLSFSWFRGELESYTTSNEQSLSARGTINGKCGYINSEKIDNSTIDYVIEKIKENASVNNSADEVIIFKGSPKYTNKKVFNPKLGLIPTEEKIALLKNLEAKLKAADSRIVDVELGYQEGIDDYVLMNSYGLNLKSKTNYYAIYANCIARGQNDETKTGYKSFFDSDFDKFDVDKFVNELLDETLSQLGGEACESKKYKAVLNSQVTASLLSSFISHSIADEVQKNTSMFKDKLHQKIASSKVTIEERPLDKSPLFRSFDDEGVATFNKKIVNKGVLETYLYNLATAKKDNVESTGNGYRGGGKVVTSTVNLVLKPGTKSEADLFKMIGEGIYITDVEGLHSGLNAQSGNFSLQAKGYLIENGARGRPVCLITIAGNLFELFKDVKEVGSNSTRHGSVLSPSVYIKSIAVSGK